MGAGELRTATINVCLKSKGLAFHIHQQGRAFCTFLNVTSLIDDTFPKMLVMVPRLN
jgi:hypothetical protein